MPAHEATSPGNAPATAGHPASGDRAYRRAWWSLALFPVSFVAAFVIGDGLHSLLASDPDDPAVWEVVASATPALLVFAIPGMLAVSQGRSAMRFGRREGVIPALIGAAIALGFLALNVLAYLVTREAG